MSAQPEECYSATPPFITITGDEKGEELLKQWRDAERTPDVSVFEGPTQLPQSPAKSYWKQFEIGRSGLPKCFEKMVNNDIKLARLVHEVCDPETLRKCAIHRQFRRSYAKMQAICVFGESTQRRYVVHPGDFQEFEHKNFVTYLKRCANIANAINKSD